MTMHDSSDFAAQVTADDQLWPDFLAICDCGGRLAGTESEVRAFALVEARAEAATGVKGRSIPVPYGGWRAKRASLRLPGGAEALCRALVRSIPGRAFFYGFANLPLFIPDIVLGIALLVLLTRIALPLSLFTVVLGHFVLCLPFAVGVLMSRLEGFDISLEEASRDLGENAWGTFRRVTLPLVLPAVISSLLLSFVVSFDDFLIAFFLCGTDTTLPVYIWGELRFPYKLPNVLALGATILMVSTVVIAIAESLRRPGVARR